MRKFLKWLGACVGILFLLIILSTICLMTLVNPNRLKSLIAEQVMRNTGRQLTLDGDLSWSLFPYLGIKTGHLMLSNPPDFKEKIFAEIQHATIGVKLFPLFHKTIESSGIVLDGLKLNLIRESNGKNNWQFRQILPTTPSAAISSARSNAPNMKIQSMGLAISSIKISNSAVNWIDKQNKKSGSIDKLNLDAQNISFLKSFPISSEFHFMSGNPVLSGHIEFISEMSLNINQQILSLKDLVLIAALQQGNQKFNWKIKGDVIANLQQQMFQGQFRSDTFQMKKITLSHLVIPMYYKMGMLKLAPITADFYKGFLKASTEINLLGALPQIAIQATLSNVRIESLLQDLVSNSQKLNLMGVGDMELQINTRGNNYNAIIRNLNGLGHLSINQGILQGIDIGYLIDSAYAFAKQKALTTRDAKQTDFGNLTANIVLRDGIMFNNDLLLDSSRFKTKGKGSIDLVNQKIDFRLQTVINQSAMSTKEDWGNLYGLPIPIEIMGNLNDPIIRLDAAVLAKAVAEQQIKKIESKVQDQIKDNIRGKTGKILQDLLSH